VIALAAAFVLGFIAGIAFCLWLARDVEVATTREF
jgi:hypothetical protein